MNRYLIPKPKSRFSRGCRMAGALAKSALLPGRSPTAYEEMQSGALIGFLACLVFALAAGAAAPLVAFSAIVGLCAGGVFGLVLWSGSADLPEDPVLPPHPSQRCEQLSPG